MNKTLSILNDYCELRKKFLDKGMATREVTPYNNIQTM